MTEHLRDFELDDLTEILMTRLEHHIRVDDGDDDDDDDDDDHIIYMDLYKSDGCLGFLNH